MHAAWLWAAFSALIPLSSALAANVDPALRPSEQIDMRRLGKVSDDERSVLRVEWRAAATGADEARAVQDMLDSLRRMQGTVGEINRLIRAMPAQKAVVETAAAEPSESGLSDKTLALAGSAVVGLLAIWLSRRRESAMPAVRAPAVAVAPEPKPLATIETPPEAEPTPAAQPVGEASSPATAPSPAQDTPPLEPRAADVAPIEFSLEEADPESIARANAKLEKLRAKRSAEAPAIAQEAHVEPTLELAEIMLSLGLDQGAAQTLVEYTEANPRQALHHWLKLLDIYRNSGHVEEFKETAEKLRRNFNIQAEDWAKANTAEAPTLEGFARLADHVQQVWTKPEECIAYLQNLLEDNREGARAGFPQPVAEEILLLIDILKETSGANQAAGA